MALLLNEDEVMLRESAEGFFGDNAPVSALRELRDGRSEDGIDRALWTQMAEMGYTGVLVGEDQGGVDMGYMAAGLLAETMGRNLSASPFLSTSVLAATALRACGEGEVQNLWLSKIATGEAILSVAVDEHAKHNPSQIETRAVRSGNGFKISGSKTAVIDGHIADAIIIAARTSDDGISLFLVDPKSKGLITERTIMVDSRNSARIELDEVEVTADALLGEFDGGIEILTKVLNAGRAVLAAELLGAGGQAFGLTVDYIKERKQFGKIIGEFQALQHRASHMYTELELSRSAVLGALTALDENDPKAEIYCSMAKAKLGQTAKLIGLEGVQMFAGVGMTDEYDIGLFLKRIRAAQELLGDGNFQMEHIAKAMEF